MKPRAMIAVCVLGVLAATASAHTVYVDLNGGGDYLTIQEGINAATSGDTVLVAPGTYTGPMNRDMYFAGKGIYLVSEEGAEQTVIDCQHAGRAFVLTGSETPDAVIEEFTITNGSAPDSGDTAGWGGALYIANSAPVFVYCIFTNNEGLYGGAAYFGISSFVEMVACEFYNNTAELYGGGIYTYGSQLIVGRCYFEENQAVISGGGICCKTGSLAFITDCDFYQNTAADGGAVYIGTFFEPGTEPEEPSKVWWCEFKENTANRGGALFINGFTWVKALSCLFEHNTAVNQGGAVFALTDYTRSLAIQNCTLCFNSAEFGGGIYSAGTYGFQMNVEQSIIAFNSQGGAVRAEDYSTISPTLCLAFENVGGDELLGSRNMVEDPLFCSVYDGDYRLCENSPCLAENHPWGFGLGITQQSCEPCAAPVEETSWGSIKAMYR